MHKAIVGFESRVYCKSRVRGEAGIGGRILGSATTPALPEGQASDKTIIGCFFDCNRTRSIPFRVWRGAALV